MSKKLETVVGTDGGTGWKPFLVCRAKYEVSICTFYNIDVTDMTIR